ncbi:2-keto-4-pentenoate hydratase [Ureibacillus composti]
MITKSNVATIVDLLNEAETTGNSIAPLTEQVNDLSIEDAYAVQLERITQKVEANDVITGKKIGLTSIAMQQLLGVDQPDYGHLLQSMEVENNGTVSLKSLFQPKIEGEIAFVLKRDLVGPNVTAEDVRQATDYVIAAIEIVDSRIKDWKITLADTIADNASCGLYVLGEKQVKLDAVDLKEVTMQLLRNGEVVNEGKGTDVLGDPAICVAWLANKLHAYGITLKAGEIVLSGALSAAVVAEPGDEFTVRFTELGDAKVQFI